MALKKQYIEIEYNGKVVFVATVKEGESTDYLNAKKQATKNLAEIIRNHTELLSQFQTKINDLEKEIKHLKGED